jgi:succinate dehydrogenase / fumarate reductase flavoprotein subunit
MERYSPRHMELDARDVVARANYREIGTDAAPRTGAVLLDISHRDPDYIKDRLPNMYEQFMEQGVDITREPMKVSPTAHYGMGGIEVDPRTGATAVEGLFAVGESTAGVHGANRLGGNSLAETVVFGKILGSHLADVLDDLLPPAPLDEGAAREHFAALDVLAAGTEGGDRTREGSSTSCATSCGSTPASCAPKKACARDSRAPGPQGACREACDLRRRLEPAVRAGSQPAGHADRG